MWGVGGWRVGCPGSGPHLIVLRTYVLLALLWDHPCYACETLWDPTSNPGQPHSRQEPYTLGALLTAWAHRAACLHSNEQRIAPLFLFTWLLACNREAAWEVRGPALCFFSWNVIFCAHLAATQPTKLALVLRGEARGGGGLLGAGQALKLNWFQFEKGELG